MIQILLGAVVVWLELPAMAVLVHLGFAMAILGLLVWIAVAAGPVPRARPPSAAAAARARRLIGWAHATTTLIFLLVLVGAYVRATGAGYACVGFPGCNGEALPFGANRSTCTCSIACWPTPSRPSPPSCCGKPGAPGAGCRRCRARRRSSRRWSSCRSALGPWRSRRGSRRMPAGRTWPARRRSGGGRGADLPGGPRPAAGPAADRARRAGLGRARAGRGRACPRCRGPDGACPCRVRICTAAYVSLTKPRIIILLLITTLPGHGPGHSDGWPPPWLILATLLGGTMAAGGANAINCYIDRDIDELMGRTLWRPAPAARSRPRERYASACRSRSASFACPGLFVNLLSAVLAVIGSPVLRVRLHAAG